MANGHLEIEQKFEVPDSFVLPDLRNTPGVATVDAPEERLLEAIYHDTADMRLLRTPVTLRRRTGGPDAGWHVKLPAGAGARRELQFPLGDAHTGPPPEVLAPVRGLVRNAAVRPVARLRTTRRVTLLRSAAGEVLAEVADDSVVATAPAAAAGAAASVISWRELEVELVDGDRDLLAAVADRLFAAGARPSGSDSKLGRVLGDRLAALDTADTRKAVGAPDKTDKTDKADRTAKNGKAARSAGKSGKSGRKSAGPTAADVVLGALTAQVKALQTADMGVRTGNPEGVHDLRVACRRLRSVLAAFRPVLDRQSTEPLRAELQWLGAQLSAARDGEVALAHLRAMVDAEVPELVRGPVAARLAQAQAADAQAGREAAEAALADPRYFATVDALFGLLARPPLAGAAREPAARVLADAVRHSGKRMRERIRQARAEDSTEHLHEVRKAAKRVRYTAEVAAEVHGGRTSDLVETMKQVQDVLGEGQDTVVTRARCLQIGAAAQAAGEDSWTYGRLHALEQARAERAQAAYRALEPAVIDALRRASKA